MACGMIDAFAASFDVCTYSCSVWSGLGSFWEATFPMMRPMICFGPLNPGSIAGRDADADRNARWAVWIERMAKGDLHALSCLYDESSSAIFGFVLRIVNDREVAESLLVEIYDRALREARTFKSKGQTALNWLIVRAQNLAAGHLRRSAPAAGLRADLFKHHCDSMNFALATLSKEERHILTMTYLGALTVREVAHVLEVTPEYVKQQIVAAMKKLRAGKTERR